MDILDPDDRTRTDSIRLAALRILNNAFETSGTAIKNYPSLMSLIQDHGCKYLFQLARSTNPNILQMSLRVVSTMLETMRSKLKLQQELFLAFTIDKLAPAVPTRAQISAIAQSKGLTASPRPGSSEPGTPISSSPVMNEVDDENVGPSKPAIDPARGETRELMLETLSHIARYPSFMVDLFVNYDCDVNCEDLFERLIDFLTKARISICSAYNLSYEKHPGCVRYTNTAARSITTILAVVVSRVTTRICKAYVREGNSCASLC